MIFNKNKLLINYPVSLLCDAGLRTGQLVLCARQALFFGADLSVSLSQARLHVPQALRLQLCLTL